MSNLLSQRISETFTQPMHGYADSRLSHPQLIRRALIVFASVPCEKFLQNPELLRLPPPVKSFTHTRPGAIQLR